MCIGWILNEIGGKFAQSNRSCREYSKMEKRKQLNIQFLLKHSSPSLINAASAIHILIEIEKPSEGNKNENICVLAISNCQNAEIPTMSTFDIII